MFQWQSLDHENRLKIYSCTPDLCTETKQNFKSRKSKESILWRVRYPPTPKKLFDTICHKRYYKNIRNKYTKFIRGQQSWFWYQFKSCHALHVTWMHPSMAESNIAAKAYNGNVSRSHDYGCSKIILTLLKEQFLHVRDSFTCICDRYLFSSRCVYHRVLQMTFSLTGYQYLQFENVYKIRCNFVLDTLSEPAWHY